MVMGRNSSIEARANAREVVGVISPVFIVFASGTLLCVLCVSVVIGIHNTTTTETQRTQRSHKEEFNSGRRNCLLNRPQFCKDHFRSPAPVALVTTNAFPFQRSVLYRVHSGVSVRVSTVRSPDRNRDRTNSQGPEGWLGLHYPLRNDGCHHRHRHRPPMWPGSG